MCRFTLYLGPSIRMSALVTEPKNSLIHQSFESQEREERLNGDGNVGYSIDFRAVYATVLERWWGVPSQSALGGRFAPVPFLRT